MSAFDALKGWPGISDASADELFAHPAWAMPCQWGDERCILRRAAAKPRDVIGIAITLDDDPCFLGLGNRETFPDLHDLWTRKAELPSALILALIEKECGDLLQMIENVARRQVGAQVFLNIGDRLFDKRTVRPHVLGLNTRLADRLAKHAVKKLF